jgi:ethanolamine utilization protein EutA (predicted chaperonin)
MQTGSSSGNTRRVTGIKPLRHDDPDEHFHGDREELETEDILGLEAFKQKSVGIDIGSSTSHLIFSELLLRREGFSSRFKVAERHILYQSPILLTPYTSGTLIDSNALQDFVEASYREAGVEPEDVDSGAVVITGEALNKENAQPIVEMFSRQAGKFICASAGPNHEALLAAYGSGAVALSEEHGWRLLSVDMGGGTTKLALIDRGQVVETAAMSVGARLIAFDEKDRLTRIEDPARVIAGSEAAGLELDRTVSETTREMLTTRMVDCLFGVILARPASTLTQKLMITDCLSQYRGLSSVDRVVFSGGVSEYVYGRDDVAYGDLGPLLGRGVRQRMEEAGAQLIAHSSTGIRATVIGAGEYTVQASGNTSYISSRDLLPVYARKAVRPEKAPPQLLGEAIQRALRKYDLDRFTDDLALAISLDEPPLTYPYLRGVAEAVAGVASDADDLSCLFLIVDKDASRTLGSILKEELNLPQELIALDGIELGDLDYVDIGRPMGASDVMPVTVKSLIFPTRASS